VIAIFKESDGNEPVYLCDAHVAEVERAAPVAGAKDQVADTPPAQIPGRKKEDRPKEDPRQDSATAYRNKEAHRAKPAEVPASAPNLAASPSLASSPKVGASANVSAAPDIGPAQSALKIGRRAKDFVVRARVRDLTYGDSAKALVDEAIWNLVPGDIEVYRAALQNGLPPIEAAQAAGGQLAVIVRKISEYAQALEALLSRSNATISLLEAINKPVERVMLELIGKTEIGDAEKDAGLEQLGAFQESVSRGLGPEITPVQALKIACAVGERANWGTGPEIPEELKPACTAVYSSIRSAMLAAIPDITAPFERLMNLYVAKAELESAHPPNLSHDGDVVDATTRN
jgi:hypothetical protein